MNSPTRVPSIPFRMRAVRKNPSETYAQFRAREMRRAAEFCDYRAVWFCLHVQSPLKRKRFLRAFYGIEMSWIDL